MESTLPQKNNLMQDSEGNEENGYPTLDPNKTKINDTIIEEILQLITENFMEKILDVVNQKVQDTLKKFHDTKNKEYEKTQKPVNELRGALNKHQGETRTL
jgi:esterase/lipase